MRTSIRLIVSVPVLLALAYFGAAALYLRYGIESHIIAAGESVNVPGPSTMEFPSSSGSPLLVRIAGIGVSGCAAIFPGQRGPGTAYEAALVPQLTQRGIAVHLISYPGEDGSRRIAPLHEVIALSRTALAAIAARCAPHPVAVIGRSLGTMVAAYAASAAHPSGLLLESASPSLSMASYAQLGLSWLTRPLRLLPIAALVPVDYSLNAALADSAIPRIVIFQGTADVMTPYADLDAPGALPPGIERITVPGGTHSGAFTMETQRYIRIILEMLGLEARS